MATYSFIDVNASINGTGGNINIGANAGAAEGGITIAPVGDKNTMTIGADGSVMHSLHAAEASEVTVRLLKTSPVNAQLQAMYNTQTVSSSAHGTNTITVTILQTGENITISQAAFKKRPSMEYAKEAKEIEWTFDGGKTTTTLGKWGSN